MIHKHAYNGINSKNLAQKLFLLQWQENRCIITIGTIFVFMVSWQIYGLYKNNFLYLNQNQESEPMDPFHDSVQ